MNELLRNIFGPGGPGFVVVQIVFVAVVGWLGGYLAAAAGKGSLAQMIHVASVFIAIVLVAAQAALALKAFAAFIGY